MRMLGAAALMAGFGAGLVVAAGVAVENLAFRRLAAAFRTVMVRTAALLPPLWALLLWLPPLLPPPMYFGPFLPSE